MVITSELSPLSALTATDTSIRFFFATSPKMIFPFKSGYLTNKLANNFIK